MTGISYAHSLLSLNIISMCVNLTIVPDIVSYLQLQHNLTITTRCKIRIMIKSRDLIS